MSLDNLIRTYCVICEKDYDSPRSLTQHWELRHDTETRRFITEDEYVKRIPDSSKNCEICGLRFSSNFSKRRHLQVHGKSVVEKKQRKKRATKQRKVVKPAKQKVVKPAKQKVEETQKEPNVEEKQKEPNVEEKQKASNVEEKQKELRIVHFPFLFGWYDVASSYFCSPPEQASPISIPIPPRLFHSQQ